MDYLYCLFVKEFITYQVINIYEYYTIYKDIHIKDIKQFLFLYVRLYFYFK